MTAPTEAIVLTQAKPIQISTDSPQPPRLTSSSLIARNATLNLMTQGWIFLVLLVAMPKLVAYLGEGPFGLFSLAWVVIGYLSFLDVGVNRAATKFVSEHLVEQDYESIRGIVRTALASNLSLGLSGGLAIALLSPYLIHSIFKLSNGVETQARWTFYVVALAVPVLLVQGIGRAVLSSFQRFGSIDAIEASATTLQWGIAGVLAWRGYPVALVVFSTVLVRITATVAYAIAVSRLVPGLHLFRIRALHGFRRLLHFGSWVTVSQVTSPLLVYLDRIMIASFLSLSAVTLYTVPFEATARLRIIPMSLAGTIYPAFSERGNEHQKEGLQALYERSLHYLLLILVPSVVYLLMVGPDLFVFWMGPSFAQHTSIVVRILSLGILANALAYVPYSLLQAIGRPDLTGKFHLLELPVYVSLCLLLIPRWGIAGAALASTVRFALDGALLFWATGRYSGCSLARFWARSLPQVLVLGGALALTLWAMGRVLASPLARLGLGAIAVGLSLVASWAFAVKDSEKPRIRGMVRALFAPASS